MATSIKNIGLNPYLFPLSWGWTTSSVAPQLQLIRSIALLTILSLAAVTTIFLIKKRFKRAPNSAVNQLPVQVRNPLVRESIQRSPNQPLVQELPPSVPPAKGLDVYKQESLEYLAQLEKDLQEQGTARTPISEDILCEYFSHLATNFTGKRLTVLSFDLGGFGDFTFGCKVITMLQKRFWGMDFVLASDNPVRALKVNGSYNHTLLMPSVPPSGSLDHPSVLELIDHYVPHFLLVAPVVHTLRETFEPLLGKTPHLLLREYGFMRGFDPPKEGEYVSGAGDPCWKGVIVHQELIEWAASPESEIPLERLKQLSHIPPEVTTEILGGPYSPSQCEEFARKNELFMAYGNELSQAQYILAIVEMHRRLQTDKNLTFVILGIPLKLLELLQEYSRKFSEAGFGKIDWVALNTHPLTRHKWDVSHGIKQIKFLAVSLLPEDTIRLCKASEKEIATTGDHSWIEGVSAHKRWIQQDLIHKRHSLQGVLNLCRDIPAIDPAFLAKLKEAHKSTPIFKLSLPHVEAQADLFTLCRQKPEFARSWEFLNDAVSYEYSLEPWLRGMIIKRYLEHSAPEFKLRTAQLLQQREVPSQDLLSYLRHTQSLLA